ncbi:MAG: peptidase S8 [Ruminiclostridium sp.]|nr:peptidase S8 [Ruminiclostridium sp.]
MVKRFIILLIGVLIMTQVLAVGVGAANDNGQAARKIVVFKQDFTGKQAKDKVLNKYGAQKVKHLDIINATAVMLTPTVEKLLAKDGSVLRIDEDIEVYAIGKPAPVPSPTPKPDPNSNEVLPWGIDRIDAERVTIDDGAGTNIKVGVIDTGIDLTHPELASVVKGGVNTIDNPESTNYADNNGHGTHVAGIIAALDNEVGVVGVSSRIDLYSIKVLDSSGSGYLIDVIEGLQWAANNGMQVVNMSLGTKTYIKSFEDAVNAAYNNDIVLVAAAGNESGPVSYPAAFSNVMAVSATDINNKIAKFSNRGPEIDVAAPGVSILSTYIGSTYATFSGTSMASPHVAGVAALVLTAGKGDLNGDGFQSPAEVMARIKNTATVLPSESRYTYKYGSGLVNALNAVTP